MNCGTHPMLSLCMVPLPVKRAEALARAGELGAVVRALTSEGVLDAKEHIQKLQVLHPYEDPPMMPGSLDSLHGDSSSHAHNTSP